MTKDKRWMGGKGLDNKRNVNENLKITQRRGNQAAKTPRESIYAVLQLKPICQFNLDLL